MNGGSSRMNVLEARDPTRARVRWKGNEEKGEWGKDWW